MKLINHKLLLILLAIISCCNAYIFFNRDDFAFIKQSSYAGLYPVTGNPSVINFVAENDSTLRIVLNNIKAKSLKWKICTDEGLPVLLSAAEPVFQLREGVHSYRIFTNELPDTIRIKAQYISKKQLNEKYSVLISGITIYKADLPVESEELYNSRWLNNEIPVTAVEAGAIQIILKDSMGINNNENTFEKIKKIGQYLGYSLSGTCGFPSDSVNGLPVFQQYKAAVKGSKIWCGNYAGIFNLFARSANIRTRSIQIGRTYGTMTSNGHIFNEYYIPEQKKWAAADITFNNVSYIDASGRLLNAVEVKNLDPADSSVKVFRSDLKGSLFLKPFSTLEEDFYGIFGVDKNLWFYKTVYTNKVYSFTQKLKRYVTKDSWYEIYSDSMIVDNFNFYIKLLFLVIEIGLLFLLFFILILRGFRRRSPHWRKSSAGSLNDN